jgi:hypothetical protein
MGVLGISENYLTMNSHPISVYVFTACSENTLDQFFSDFTELEAMWTAGSTAEREGILHIIDCVKSADF